MAKKRKRTKLSEHQQRKIEDAQRLKSYIKRLFDLMRRMGIPEVIPYISSKRDLHRMFLIRTSPMKIDMSRAPHFDKAAKKELQGFFHGECSRNMIPFSKDESDGRAMSTTEFYEFWMPLSTIISVDQPLLYQQIKDAEQARIVRDMINPETRENDETIDWGKDFVELFYRVDRALDSIISLFCLEFSNPTTYYLYAEKAEPGINDVIGKKIGRELNLITQKGEYETIKVKGEIRRAFHAKIVLSYSINDIVVRVPYHPQFNSNPDKVYRVFILEHAIKRMFERVDGIYPPVINLYFNLSIATCDAGWFKGSLMIDYKVKDIKLGYFVGDIVGDKILIRTFLFITYNGTFEGELLNRCTGFEKLDKKFLSIDKLSSFLASNIDKKSPAGRIFCEANCEHLLNLEYLNTILSKTAENSGISGDFLMKYLRFDNDESVGDVDNRAT